MAAIHPVFPLYELPTWFSITVFPLNRWVHLVATTLLVGGVLFFEFVVPLATADLKEEQQLAVFGRARWVFRKIVRLSVIAMLLSGGISLWRTWHIYNADEAQVGGFWLGSKPWVLAHIILGVLGFAILLRVTGTRTIHSHPVGWMRLCLVVLLSGMFLASIARHVRLSVGAWREQSLGMPQENRQTSAD